MDGSNPSQPSSRGRRWGGHKGRSKEQNRFKNELQPNDSVPFESVLDSQLDHLVPLEQRREHETAQNGGDVDGLMEFSREDQLSVLLTFKQGTDIACLRAETDRIWESGAISQLQGALHSRATRETPSQEDYAVRENLVSRINDIVSAGLLQFTGMHVDTYGSYTSGLFTPGGDMDIAIEGTLQLSADVPQSSISDDRAGLDVSELDKTDKAALLKALGKKLLQNRLCRSRPLGVYHARVPIIKFEDRQTGIPCDMAVGSGGARFKSIVLKHLSIIDPRMGSLIRLVKLWAKASNLNDAADGTFNTFALSMMVIFHLQTRNPPVLPPICFLFDQSPTEVKGRPLHAGLRAGQELQEGASVRESRAMAWKLSNRQQNEESLTELFASFFAFYAHVLNVWIANRDQRAVRCCAWAGEWTYKRWAKNYIFPIEDAFDTSDNTARSIFASNAKPVQQAFLDTQAALRQITPPLVEAVLSSIFSQKPKRESLNPFYGREGLSWREGWDRRQEEREKRQQDAGRPSNDRNRGRNRGRGARDPEVGGDEAPREYRQDFSRPRRDERRLWQPPGKVAAQPFLAPPPALRYQVYPPPGMPDLAGLFQGHHPMNAAPGLAPPAQMPISGQEHLMNLLTGAKQRKQPSGQPTAIPGGMSTARSPRQHLSTPETLLQARQELQSTYNTFPKASVEQRTPR